MRDKTYRADIDAIKGIAIIAVVFYHMGILSSGYLGVDAFFVINGFFILPAMFRLFENESVNGLIVFWEKRILRLWPLILIATLFCLLVGYWGMLPDDYENLSESIIATNLFSENILSAITTKNYWDVSNDYKPLMHMWYVGILVEFYIITPVLLWIATKYATWRNRNVETCLIITIVVLTALSFFFYLSPISEGAGRFYYLPSRFWEIALGGILAINLRYLRNNKLFESTIINSLVFIILIVLLCIGLLRPNYLPMPALVGTTFLTSFLLISNPAKSIFTKLLSSKVLTSLGKMSFSIFVWHQILLAFYRYFVTDELTPTFIVCFWAITLLLSWATYVFVEQKTKVSHRSFALAVCSMVILAIPSAAIYLHAGVVRDVPEMNIYFDNVHRGMHAEYVDRVYEMDKDFKGDKKCKVLVVGDSFARDWVNVMLESKYCDSLDISYAYSFEERLIPRIQQCDYLFIRVKKPKVPDYVWNKKKKKNVWGIGTKTFGSNNGIIYSHRNDPNYFNMTITPDEEFIAERNQEIEWWGGHYVDMMTPSMNTEGRIRVFTPNHKFISQDCTHLTQDGAQYYASIIDLDEIFLDNMKK